MQVQAFPELSIECSQALNRYRRVKYDGSDGLDYAGATDIGYGTLAEGHIVSGLGASEYATVLSWNAPGTRKMVADGSTIAVDSLLYGAASGKVGTTVNGNPIGRAMQASSTDGDEIEVYTFATAGRGELIEELAVYPITVDQLRVHDAPTTVLPATPANDDLGVVDNTHGTANPTVEAGDLGEAGETTRKTRFFWPVPDDYKAGETLTLRVNAVMATAVADDSCTLDAVVVNQDDPDADICETAAQDMNDTEAANYDFTITPTNVAPGDVIDAVLSITCTDAGTAVCTPTINSIKMLRDRKTV